MATSKRKRNRQTSPDVSLLTQYVSSGSRPHQPGSCAYPPPSRIFRSVHPCRTRTPPSPRALHSPGPAASAPSSPVDKECRHECSDSTSRPGIRDEDLLGKRRNEGIAYARQFPVHTPLSQARTAKPPAAVRQGSPEPRPRGYSSTFRRRPGQKTTGTWRTRRRSKTVRSIGEWNPPITVGAVGERIACDPVRFKRDAYPGQWEEQIRPRRGRCRSSQTARVGERRCGCGWLEETGSAGPALPTAVRQRIGGIGGVQRAAVTGREPVRRCGVECVDPWCRSDMYYTGRHHFTTEEAEEVRAISFRPRGVS